MRSLGDRVPTACPEHQHRVPFIAGQRSPLPSGASQAMQEEHQRATLHAVRERGWG